MDTVMRNIKIILTLLLSIVISLSSYDLYASEDQLIQNVDLYLYALKNGDIETLTDLMSSEELTRSKRRLKNQNYAKFLKEYYKDSIFIIEEIREISSSYFEYKIKIKSNQQIIAMPVFKFKLINGEWKMDGIKEDF
jgi:hypothetical protein